jgi:hypothetical protein
MRQPVAILVDEDLKAITIETIKPSVALTSLLIGIFLSVLREKLPDLISLSFMPRGWRGRRLPAGETQTRWLPFCRSRRQFASFSRRSNSLNDRPAVWGARFGQ